MKYTVHDLDAKVNDEETLLEFIQNSFKEFYGDEITRADLENMTDCELNMVVEELDYLWEK